MDIYEDAMALFRQPEVDWVRCEAPEEGAKEPIRPKPEAVVNREKKRGKTPKDQAGRTGYTAREGPPLQRGGSNRSVPFMVILHCTTECCGQQRNLRRWSREDMAID